MVGWPCLDILLVAERNRNNKLILVSLVSYNVLPTYPPTTNLSTQLPPTHLPAYLLSTYHLPPTHLPPTHLPIYLSTHRPTDHQPATSYPPTTYHLPTYPPSHSLLVLCAYACSVNKEKQ
ncbi:hypothetical protein C0Q70_13394 [Pomacea canaliculata]|uniref:Uncharacterized protein n=1 Tax=Pomacea canaliculata TaxID=400727 RepID=A0A2T7NX45_POMCA|nr:hypothetical protein C0Q70_13394 [Pomacea canaliculata]